MAMSKKRPPAATYGSAEFKARCLELVDRVKESRTEVIITRHGRPVAKLAPLDAREPVSLVGSMAGSVLTYDAPFDPVPGAWTVNEPEAEP
jgi:prevent-host-death family protein